MTNQYRGFKHKNTTSVQKKTEISTERKILDSEQTTQSKESKLYHLNPNNKSKSKSKSKALLVAKQTDKSKIKFESHGVCYLHDWTKKNQN